jgi:RNA polymerase primary sigma factor
MKAGRRFDEERGFRFISYAVWWIRQSITQALKDKARTVRLPSSQISLLTKVKRARTELQNEGVLNPAPEQISDRSEQSVEEVRRILQMDQVVLGLDDAEGERDQLPLVETLVAEDQVRPDDNLLQDSLRLSIRRSLASLTDREAEIISRYYGLEREDAQTLQEIGESMGLTRERIRQIKNLALEKLRGIVVEDLFYESES